jgi:hypothetical protein
VFLDLPSAREIFYVRVLRFPHPLSLVVHIDKPALEFSEHVCLQQVNDSIIPTCIALGEMGWPSVPDKPFQLDAYFVRRSVALDRGCMRLSRDRLCCKTHGAAAVVLYLKLREHGRCQIIDQIRSGSQGSVETSSVGHPSQSRNADY